jgi:hypothetical protein
MLASSYRLALFGAKRGVLPNWVGIAVTPFYS